MSFETSDTLRYIADWSPEPVESSDPLAPKQATDLAATLDLDDRFAVGSALPPLWQWIYFPEWPRTVELGADGHPHDGHFLPPIPNRRRMFAGGRISISSPLLLGESAVRRSEVTGTAVKHGSTGELLFVTVRSSYRQGPAVRLVEEQDLVYRSDAGTATSFTRTTEPLAAQSTPWAAEPVPNPALLFRFSALTANAHRIHYDEPYTTGTEGFPALVVHGPLLAIYMAELLRAHGPRRSVARFDFRLRRPVFLGDRIRVQGEPGAREERDEPGAREERKEPCAREERNGQGDGDTTVRLSVVSGAGAVHATATATYA
ncbi:MaoC/PaaZ C-terminal domain-containing protein [Mycobacterium sp. 155]|uniref:MaoC/PaaZ C-terminal domain-containing protein n=1 Tax=Mycobacterium sp. 155 TaxID=1157943 RepID=UPI0004767C5B|nr:MaoC/PaaZ C-terminal domain-containing protein [Mycobacterium sp. 155]